MQDELEKREIGDQLEEGENHLATEVWSKCTRFLVQRSDKLRFIAEILMTLSRYR